MHVRGETMTIRTLIFKTILTLSIFASSIFAGALMVEPQPIMQAPMSIQVSPYTEVIPSPQVLEPQPHLLYHTLTPDEQAQNYIDGINKDPIAPGCAVVINTDGRLRFSAEWGVARFGTDESISMPAVGFQGAQGFVFPNLHSGDVPMTIHTNIRIASITKSFVALSALRLNEEKDGFLHNNLGNIFDELKDSSSDEVTPRNLADHTSGLVREPYEDELKADNLTSAHLATYPALQADTHNTKFAYSNLGYFLLANAIEKENPDGLTWKRYISNKVFSPLNMTRSSIQDAQPLWPTNEVATEYTGKEAPFQIADLGNRGYLLGSGGVITSMWALVMQYGNALATKSDKLLKEESSWEEFVRSTTLGTYPYAMGVEPDNRDPHKVKDFSHSGYGYGIQSFLRVRIIDKTFLEGGGKYVVGGAICNGTEHAEAKGIDTEKIVNELIKIYSVPSPDLSL